jgi:hypothetical protein
MVTFFILKFNSALFMLWHIESIIPLWVDTEEVQLCGWCIMCLKIKGAQCLFGLRLCTDWQLLQNGHLSIRIVFILVQLFGLGSKYHSNVVNFKVSFVRNLFVLYFYAQTFKQFTQAVTQIDVAYRAFTACAAQYLSCVCCVSWQV